MKKNSIKKIMQQSIYAVLAIFFLLYSTNILVIPTEAATTSADTTSAGPTSAGPTSVATTSAATTSADTTSAGTTSTGTTPAGTTPTLTTSTDATAVANSLLSSNSGYTISNADYTGASGAVGSFSGANSVVGFDSGIVLSTGNLVQGGDIFSSGYSTTFDSATGGTVPNGSTYKSLGFPSENFYDLSMLRFDVTATDAGVMSFQYCMASEEYPEYLNYADQFVLSVNGTNYALIPGTSTGVSTGTVNHTTNAAYYKGIDPLSNSGAISTSNFVFDGETVVFSVNATVNAGVNHIILAIADLADSRLDSAVFIKVQSIKNTEAKPGIYSIGTKTGRNLEIDRTGGTDGYSQVDVTFNDLSGSIISSSTLTFNDGDSAKTVTIPAGAMSATISSPTGGATLDPNATTKILFNVAVPTVTDPISITKNIGDTATFSVTGSTTDAGTLSYQWQSGSDSTFTDISGATSESYMTGSLTYADNGTQYRCIVTNTKEEAIATVTSNVATLTVNAAIVAPDSSNLPKTGDHTNVFGYTLVLLLSGIYIIFGIQRKKILNIDII